MPIPSPRTLPHPVFRLLALGLAAFLAATSSPAAEPAANRPNIIVILVDDLGYGDVGFLNPNSKIRTPNLDRLAAQGMAFTDAHTAAGGTCTPARYAVLTGRYGWRSRLQARILGGYSPRLIEDGRLTLEDMLRKQGYTTAAIGKWHLGMTFAQNGPGVFNDNQTPNLSPDIVDFTKPVTGGPNAVGFDYFYGIPSSIDIAPYVLIENDRVLEPATIVLPGGRGDQGFNGGRAAASFKHVDIEPAVIAKTREYIAARAKEKTKPFFIYLATTSLHNPIVPSPQFAGKSAIGAYGDFVEQLDAEVGQVMASLKENGLDQNTMIILTSDNGPAALTDPLREQFGHSSTGDLRGVKGTHYEGGHRVPFVVTWPGHIKENSRTDALLCTTDIMATCAAITGFDLPNDAAEDSFNQLPVLLGSKLASPMRPTLVQQVDSATDLGIRRGSMTLIPNRGVPELYDLSTDPKEQKDLAAAKPELVAELQALLAKFRQDGRETGLRKAK